MMRVPGAMVLATGMTLATACSVSTADHGNRTAGDDDIVIGAAAASSGFMAAYDQPPLEAAKLAIEEINANGGLLGRRLRLEVSDTGSDRAQAVQAATEVVEGGADVVLVSCDYDYGAPAALVAQRRGLVSFSLCAQSPKFGVQGVGDLAYTPEAATLTEGVTMAEWSLSRGFESAFLLEDTTISYSQEVCRSFEQRFKEKSGTIVGRDVFKNPDASIATQISGIKSAAMDDETPVVVCSYNPGAASAIRQIRAAGIDAPIVTFNSMDGLYWLESVPNLSDVYYDAAASVFGDDPDDAVNEFVEKYTKTTGEAPVSSYALMGAVVVQLYEQAVSDAGSTESHEIKRALDSFKDVPTIVGPTTFTPDLHISLDRPLAVMEIQAGTISHLEDFQASAPPKFTVE